MNTLFTWKKYASALNIEISSALPKEAFRDFSYMLQAISGAQKIQNPSLFKYAGHSGAFISGTMESPSTNIANFRLPQIGIRMREVMFKNKVLLKKNYACQEFSTHAYVTDCFQTERLLQKQLLQIMVSSVLNINMV